MLSFYGGYIKEQEFGTGARRYEIKIPNLSKQDNIELYEGKAKILGLPSNFTVFEPVKFNTNDEYTKEFLRNNLVKVESEKDDTTLTFTFTFSKGLGSDKELVFYYYV